MTKRETEKDREKEPEGKQMMNKLWAEEVLSGRSGSSVSVNIMTVSLSVKYVRTRRSDITKKRIMEKNSCQNAPLTRAFGCLKMQKRTAYDSFSTQLHLL